MTKAEKLHIYTGHKGGLYCLCPALEAGYFYSAGSDAYVVRWKIGMPEDAFAVVKMPAIVYSLALIKEQALLLAGDFKGSLHIVDLAKNKAIKNLQLNEGPIFDILYHAAQAQIFLACGNGVLIVLDAAFKIIFKQKLCDEKLRNISIHYPNNELALACGDGAIRTFRLTDFEYKGAINAHQHSVYSLLYTEKKLFSGGRDAHIKSWNLDGTLAHDLAAHNFAVYDLKLSPGENFGASASRDKTVKIWDPGFEEVKLRINKENYGAHSHSVNKLLWTSDSELLSTGDDGIIYHWKITN